MDDRRGADIDGIDLTGATLRRLRLNDARIRTVELVHADVRDIDLTGASFDSLDFDGLVVNGVDVAPLIKAELARREPARALMQSTDPNDLREAWRLVEDAWERTYARVADQPALADVSVDGEWSVTQTLRHLMCAIDIWLGEALGNEPRHHPWGLLFTGSESYVDAESLGLDVAADPSYDEVLAARRQRVATVRALLADATPDRLAEDLGAPPWSSGDRVSMLRSLRVVLEEEIEHRRYVERDLDAATTNTDENAPARSS